MGRLAERLWGFRHKSYVRLFSRAAPYYLVNEYPKSGGTWLAQMLASATSLPFRRNEPIRYEKAVTHGHFLKPQGLRNTVVLWRDPRDVIVSFYYHCYFVNEHGNGLFVQLMKDRSRFSDYTDVAANLPHFIRLLSHHPISPRFSWPQFADVWVNRSGVIHTSYEALRRDTPSEIAEIVKCLYGYTLDSARAREVADEFDFTRVKEKADSNRKNGAEVSFIREGALGGWKKHFTQEAESVLVEEGYLEAMKVLGYCDDRYPSLKTPY